MDEKTKQINAKDLKFYRFTIAVVVAIAIAIGLGVGVFTINSYGNNKEATDIFYRSKIVTNLLMNKKITSQEQIDGEYMTFYREDNPDFDPENTDDVSEAISVYYIDENGEKQYLPDGIYYPNGSVNGTVDPVNVRWGFYFTAFQNLRIVQNVLKTLMMPIALVVFVFIIWLWYRNWCKREDKKAELAKQQLEFSKKKNDLD